MTHTTIPVDDDLIEQAMELTGARTKREAVVIALRRLVEEGNLRRARYGAREEPAWDGDLEAWRRSRT